MFFIQQKIFVTPEQLEKKHREIIEEIEEKNVEEVEDNDVEVLEDNISKEK